MIANERSVTRKMTAFFSKKEIMQTSEQPSVHIDAYRMYGGSIFNRAARKIGRFWKKVKALKPSRALGVASSVSGLIPHPMARGVSAGLGVAAKGLNMVGAGNSGGMYTAAGMDHVPSKLRHRVSK
jgi:hypothetical protein